MKPVKNFEEFRKHLNESRSILAPITGALKWLGEIFVGKGSNFLNGMMEQEKGWPSIKNKAQRDRISKAVRIIGTTADINALEKQGIKVGKGSRGALDRMLGLKESFEYLIENKDPDVKNFEGYIPENDDHALIAMHCLSETEQAIPIEAINEADTAETYINLKHPRLKNVGTAQLKKKIAVCIEGEDEGTPLLIWGAPGIGKTAIIRQVAEKSYNKRFIDYDLMTMLPEDFSLTIPQKDDSGGVSGKSKLARIIDEYLPMFRESDGKAGDDAVNGIDGTGGVLFFDEIARCKAGVQAACLKLTDENRRLGEFKLGSRWSTIAAANREDDDVTGESSFNFSKTLGNRFMNVNYAPSFEEWEAWAQHPTTVDKEGKPIVDKHILAFLRFAQKHFHRLGTIHSDDFSWPSPRAWTRVSRTIRKAIEIENRERSAKGKSPLSPKEEAAVKVDYIEDAVGKTAATEFEGFMKLLLKDGMIESIEKVYTDYKKGPQWVNLTADEQYAVAVAVGLAAEKYTKLEEVNLMNLAKYLNSHQDADGAGKWALMILKMVLRLHPKIKETDYFNEHVLNDLVDAYPDTFKDFDEEE